MPARHKRGNSKPQRSLESPALPSPHKPPADALAPILGDAVIVKLLEAALVLRDTQRRV
jgi:hypothetical protein